MGKPPSSQREPYNCPPDFLQKNFPALSQAIFYPFLFLCLSERGCAGGRGVFLSTGVPKLSVERNAENIRKADTNAVNRRDGEN